MNGKQVVMTAILAGLIAVLLAAIAPCAGGDQIEVAGLVKDNDNYPVDGARLTIYNAGTGGITSVISDEGTWSSTLATGYYSVKLSGEGYNNSFYWIEVPDEYEYPPMDVGVFRMSKVLEADSMQNGTIYDSSTMARLGGATLTIWDDTLDIGIGPFTSTTAGAKKKRNGNYTVSYAAGSWRMSIDANGYVIRWTNITIDTNSTPWINYTLDPMPEGFIVDGKVKDHDTGEQIVGANVTLVPRNMTVWDDPDFEFTASTKTLGYGVIRNVPAGNYFLTINAEGYDGYIDTEIQVSGDRNFGNTDTIYLNATGNGGATIDIVVDEGWNAAVSAREDITADRDLRNFSWDMELYSLWDNYGFGGVGPHALSGATFGDGTLSAEEFLLIEDLHDYAAVPDRYASLMTVRNGTQRVVYEADLTDADIDNEGWWMTWEFTLEHADDMENVYLAIESELKYDGTQLYVYTFDLPEGWYPVRTSDEDFEFEYLANGYVISEGNGTGRELFVADISNDDGVPTAHISVDNEWDGVVNESVRADLNATASVDVGEFQSGIVLYKWDFGDGEMENITKNMTKHTYDVPGIYEVSLTVVDEANHTSAVFVYSLTIADTTAPSVTVHFPQVEDVVGHGDVINLTSVEGVAVNVTVNVTDEERVDTDYEMLLQIREKDLGDEAKWTNVSWEGLVPFEGNLTQYAAHTASAPGNYTVKVTVTDDSGNEKVVTASFFIWDLIPPTVDIVVKNSTKHVIDPANDTILENLQTTFDASDSTDNSGLLKVIWEFGDGTKDKEKDDATDSGDYNDIVKHVYHEPGTFQVNATVWDEWGNSADASFNITVLDNVAPVAKFTTTVDGETGSHVDEETGVMMFNATGSSDTSDVILYYLWWFGDEEVVKNNKSEDITPPGANLTTPYVNHSWEDPGTFSVKLVVWDGANHDASITKTVKVINRDKVDFRIEIVKDETSTRIRQGEKAKVTVKITNRGDIDFKQADLAEGVDLVVALFTGEDNENPRASLVITEDIAMNETITKVLTWKPRKGTYEIRAVVDPDDLIDELRTDGSGEGNEATVNLKVDAPKQADLTPYIVATLAVVIAIFGLLLWKKSRLSAMETKLHGKKESKKEKGKK